MKNSSICTILPSVKTFIFFRRKKIFKFSFALRKKIVVEANEKCSRKCENNWGCRAAKQVGAIDRHLRETGSARKRCAETNQLPLCKTQLLITLIHQCLLLFSTRADSRPFYFFANTTFVWDFLRKFNDIWELFLCFFLFFFLLSSFTSHLSHDVFAGWRPIWFCLRMWSAREEKSTQTDSLCCVGYFSVFFSLAFSVFFL